MKLITKLFGSKHRKKQPTPIHDVYVSHTGEILEIHPINPLYRSAMLMLVLTLSFGMITGFTKDTSTQKVVQPPTALEIQAALDSDKAERFVAYIKHINPKIDKTIARKQADAVIKYSRLFNHDPKLILSLIKQESHFDPKVVSTSGAVGLTQVILGYHVKVAMEAREVTGTHDVFDIDNNIYMGCKILRQYTDQSRGNTHRALQKYLGHPPENFELNVAYADDVLSAEAKADWYLNVKLKMKTKQVAQTIKM